MRRRNSVFHDLLKRVPRAAFDRLVAARGADRGVRRLRSRDRLIALLYGQLSGANSLREIVGGLHSRKARLYHVGARAVERSTLAGANAKRPAGLFAALFAEMVGGARRGLRRKIGAAACPIDATGVRRRSRPAPLASSVFDLGYYDFARWAALDAAGWRIVTRFKSNTPLTASTERALPEDANILSDRIGLLAQRQARHRQGAAHPLQRPRGPGPGHRRPLQTAPGPRVVLQMDRADPQDRTLPRRQRECGPHPGRRRPGRLPAAPPRQGRPGRRQIPARLRTPRARQSHARKAHRPTQRSPHTAPQTQQSNRHTMAPNLNRTPVKQVRP